MWWTDTAISSCGSPHWKYWCGYWPSLAQRMQFVVPASCIYSVLLICSFRHHEWCISLCSFIDRRKDSIWQQSQKKPSSCPRCSRIINHPKLTYGNLVFNVCPDTLRSHHTKLPADAPSLWVHKNSWNSFLFKHPVLYSLGVKLLLAGGWGLDPPSTTHYSWYKLIGFCSFLQLYLYNFILK